MLRLENIGKIYRTTEVETRALDGVSLEVDAGEFVAIMGPSGCGKSTLLNVLGLLDTPDSGAYWFCGQDVAKFSESQLTTLRRTGVGFIFQSFNLIDDLNVAENVEVALLYRRVSGAERRRRVAAALERVGNRPSRKTSSAATFRRTAATRRGGTRPGRGTEVDPGRRADRESRYGERCSGHVAAGRHQSRWHDRRHGDPFLGSCGARQADYQASGRPRRQ